jgi:hypothetical protein
MGKKVVTTNAIGSPWGGVTKPDSRRKLNTDKKSKKGK